MSPYMAERKREGGRWRERERERERVKLNKIAKMKREEKGGGRD